MKKKQITLLCAGILSLTLTVAIFLNLGRISTYAKLFSRNKGSVSVGNVDISIPFYFVRAVNDKSITFAKYPDDKSLVYIYANKSYDYNRYVEKYKRNKSLKGYSINEKEYAINGIPVRWITLTSLGAQNYEVIIFFKTKNVFVHFLGNRETWEDYYRVIRSIHFKDY